MVVSILSLNISVPLMEVPYCCQVANTDNGSNHLFMKLFSDRDRDIYQMINYYVISSAISVFGVGANVINIVVFFKQGFHNTMNISLFGLAISDLCSLIPLFWANINMSGLLVSAGLNMSPNEVAYLTGGHPHICFARITSWITVFITAERCLCITFPLKIKQIITPRRTAVIVSAIYILIILSFEPEYQTAYIGWKFDLITNQTFIGLLFTSDRHNYEGIVFILYSLLGFTSFVAVIVLTLILAIQLNKNSKWRKEVTINSSHSDTKSAREAKTMRMVVMIATVLIICYAPGVAVSSVSFFVPEFNVQGRYVNSFFVLWSFVFIFEASNSSVNIFCYYHMSTNYRKTFRRVFCRNKSNV